MVNECQCMLSLPVIVQTIVAVQLGSPHPMGARGSADVHDNTLARYRVCGGETCSNAESTINTSLPASFIY